MFLFVDGQPVVLRFNQVEQRYYAAFVDQFPEAEVSISQWRGSYEYQTLYPAMQQMVENGIMTLDALNEILGVIAATNQSIYRPAVLQSRVAERFAQAGYEATARVADATTRGIVAICVDQDRIARTMTIGAATVDPDDAGYTADHFGNLTNTSFRGGLITDLSTSSDIANTSTFLAISPTPSDLGDIAVNFGGAFSHTSNFAYSSGPGYWVDSDPELASLIRESVGLEVTITLDGDAGSLPANDDDDLIGNLIRDEMLPAGQHMEGDIVYPTALSNGQALDIRWRIPAKTTHEFRTTIQRSRGSQYPMHSVDEIIILFNANYADQMGIGRDITPATYLTPSDLKWAAAVTTEWSADGGATWSEAIKPAQYFDQFLAELDPANVVIV